MQKEAERFKRIRKKSAKTKRKKKQRKKENPIKEWGEYAYIDDREPKYRLNILLADEYEHYRLDEVMLALRK